MDICVQSGGIIEHLGMVGCYEAIAKAGFKGIDWNAVEHALPGNRIRAFDFAGNVYELSDEEIFAHFLPEVEEIRRNGLFINQCHAPFPAYVPGHPEVLEYMIGVYRKLIRLCDRVDCKHVIIHGISLAPSDRENTPESIERMNMHLYESLIPDLQNCDVTVCLENLFSWDASAVEGVCSDPHKAVEYIDKLNAKAGMECFGLCLDTGHLLLLGKDFRSYIPVLGKRIKALHIHDNDSRIDRHLAPMTGKANWGDFCDMLRGIGYKGNLSFETFAQVNMAVKFDKRMIAPWLALIYASGVVMRDRILN